jgi:CheY-like chemotaxis protein
MPAILVVDDDPDVLEYVGDVLSQHGHVIVTATDGIDALDRLGAMPAVPCMILTDLMMPRMDGWQLVSAIEANPDWSSIPTVIMSAAPPTSGPPGRLFLRKPINTRLLLSTAATHCPAEPAVPM